MSGISREQFSKSVKWKIVNLIVTKGLNFLISVIIARLIAPDNYGYMVIWSILLTFGDVLVVNGTDTVLIQKQIEKKEDWNTGFSLCFARAILLTCVFWIIAPSVASFYDVLELEILIRIASLEFLMQPFVVIGTAKCAKKMNYKVVFISDLLSTCLGGVISLFLIVLNKEVYVLVFYTVAKQLFYAIMLTWLMKNSIRFAIDKYSAKIIFFDGFKAMGNGFLDISSSFFCSLFMGKTWLPAELGYNSKAQNLAQILGVESYNVISQILLPTFSSYQDDKERLKKITRILVELTIYIMFPVMFGTAVCGEQIICLLFTEKWMPAVPFLQIACIYYAFNPIRQLCMYVNYSIKKYKCNNLIECCRLLMTLTVMILFIVSKKHNLIMYVLSGSIISIIVSVIYMISICIELKYTVREVIIDIFPSVVLTIVSLIPCVLIGVYIKSSIIGILVSVVVAVTIYILMSRLFKIKIFLYLKNILYERYNL